MFNSLLVVDFQYDFIDGTMACEGAEEARENAVAYINAHPDLKVLYSSDWHSPRHCSFAENGGPWPPHCVAGTHGAKIHTAFTEDVINPEQRPNPAMVYHKGTSEGEEEYSAFGAKNASGRTVAQDAGEDVLICGIAGEFCVRESALALMRAGRQVTILKDALAWVDRTKRLEILEDLQAQGARLA